MVAPGVNINLFNLTAYSPQVSAPIIGCVGPATKGPVNRLTPITDAGTYVAQFGKPADNMYAPRAALRYFGYKGQNLLNVRVGGPDLASATLVLFDVTGTVPILVLTANSPGTWANTDIQVAVTYNGSPATSYNVYVYYLGAQKESFLALTNGIAVTRINNGSNYITAQLAHGAGTTLPASTVSATTNVVNRLGFSGGNDGAFASTHSSHSSTGGFAGKRFYGKPDAVAGSRVFQNIVNITASIAAKPTYYGSVGMPVVPGSFYVRVQTGAGPTYIEFADNGALSYAPGAAGLGILAPSSGAHKGYIDYRTGNFAVLLAGGPTTFLNGTIDGIWIRGDNEAVGATQQGVGVYAGQISSAPCAVGWWNANKFSMTVTVSEQIGVDTAGGSSDSNTTAGLKALAGWIVPGSLVITPFNTSLTVPNPVYDDGFGGIRTGPRGTGTALTGSVNYKTGAWSVTWDPTGPALPANSSISAQYDIQIFDMGGGAVPGSLGTWVAGEVEQPNAAGGGATVASSDSGAQAIIGPIVPGTLHLDISLTSAGPFRAYDDGVGGWLTLPRGTPGAAAVTGSVNYSSGAWTITLPTGTVTATATVKTSYTRVSQDLARRALRGTGTQALAGGGVLAANGGVDASDPAANNVTPWSGTSFLDHRTGLWNLKLNLTPLGSGTQSFDLLSDGEIQVVYAPATILGFGDGSTTTFTGTLDLAPYRRENNRLEGWQGDATAVAGAGQALVTYSELGATPANDFWSENVVLPTNPANSVNYGTGATSIDWLGAPSAQAAVYVIAEETVLDATCRYPGDIGNERSPSILTGLYVQLTTDPTEAGALQFNVFFDGELQESFGQALTVAELVTEVNDPVNGSKLVTLTANPVSQFIVPDVANAAQDSGMAGAFTMADIIGTTIGSVSTGLQLFSDPDAVAVDWIMCPGQWHAPVIDAMQQLLQIPLRFAMGIIPMPQDPNVFTERDFVDGNFNSATPGGAAVPTAIVPFPPKAAIDTPLLGGPFVSWGSYFDAYADKEVTEPADGDIAGLIASTPAPWFPIAGLRRGRLTFDSLVYSPSRAQRNLVQGLVGEINEVVNPIINMTGVGILLYGQQTCQRELTDLNRINVMWGVNYISRFINNAAQKFPFEINDPILWREMEQDLNNIIKPLKERRGLADAFVVVDGTTTTPTDVDNLTVNAKVFIKPTLDAEFINFDLILTPQGTSFASLVGSV